MSFSDIKYPSNQGVNQLLPYTSYVAKYAQTGTNPPVSTSVYNNTGATFTWTRTGIGVYRLTSSIPLFNNGSTVVFHDKMVGNFQDGVVASMATIVNSTTIEFQVWQPLLSSTLSDNLFYGDMEIRIYQ